MVGRLESLSHRDAAVTSVVWMFRPGMPSGRGCRTDAILDSGTDGNRETATLYTGLEPGVWSRATHAQQS